MNWEPTADGLTRCLRHPESKPWGARGHCAACVADPGPEITDLEEQLAIAPDGCLSSVAHEQKLTELAQLAEEMSTKLCNGIRADGKKGRINYATAFKGLEIALKLYNAASAFTSTRERRDRVNRLERRQRALHARRGRGGHN